LPTSHIETRHSPTSHTGPTPRICFCCFVGIILTTGGRAPKRSNTPEHPPQPNITHQTTQHLHIHAPGHTTTLPQTTPSNQHQATNTNQQTSSWSTGQPSTTSHSNKCWPHLLVLAQTSSLCLNPLPPIASYPSCLCCRAFLRCFHSHHGYHNEFVAFAFFPLATVFGRSCFLFGEVESSCPPAISKPDTHQHLTQVQHPGSAFVVLWGLS